MPRFRSLASAFLLYCVSLAGLPADDLSGSVQPAPVQYLIDNNFADWKLNVRLNHADGVYAIGERMSIEVESPRDCYVHIINVNPEGRFDVLWPMEARTSNRVGVGQAVKFPDRGDHPTYVFEAAAPVGKELIVCLATTSPLNLKDPAHSALIDGFLEQLRGISQHPLTTLRTIVTRIEPDRAGWTATAFELRTVETRSGATATSPAATTASVTESLPIPQPGLAPTVDPAASSATEPTPAPAPAPAPTPTPAPTPAPAPATHSESDLVPMPGGESEGTVSTGVLAAPSGVGEVRFPGPFQLEPTAVSQSGDLRIRTTLATLKLEHGVLLFSESQLQLDSGIANGILAEAALTAGTDHLKQEFGITDEQIVRITLGRLEGREYRGAGKSGCYVWLRLYADPASNSSITIACIGDEAFLESAAARDFLESFRVLR